MNKSQCLNVTEVEIPGVNEDLRAVWGLTEGTFMGS